MKKQYSAEEVTNMFKSTAKLFESILRTVISKLEIGGEEKKVENTLSDDSKEEIVLPERNENGRIDLPEEDLSDISVSFLNSEFIKHGYDFTVYDVVKKIREMEPDYEVVYDIVKEAVHSYMEEYIESSKDYEKTFETVGSYELGFNNVIKYKFIIDEDEDEGEPAAITVTPSSDPDSVEEKNEVSPATSYKDAVKKLDYFVVNNRKPWEVKAANYVTKKLNRYGKVSFKQIQSAMSPEVPKISEIKSFFGSIPPSQPNWSLTKTHIEYKSSSATK